MSSEFDSLILRKACGQLMTGITIVTSIDAENGPAAMAANPFTPVSLEPPPVLVSVDRGDYLRSSG